MVGKRCLAAMIFVLGTAGAADQSFAGRIHTGDESGTFHARFCPELVSILAQSELAYTCQTSTGTAANVREVMASPSDLGYGQLDIFASELANLNGAGRLFPSQGRRTPVPICRNKAARPAEFRRAFGACCPAQISFAARGLHSSGTFRILQEIDAAGVEPGRSRPARGKR